MATLGSGRNPADLTFKTMLRRPRQRDRERIRVIQGGRDRTGSTFPPGSIDGTAHGASTMLS